MISNTETENQLLKKNELIIVLILLILSLGSTVLFGYLTTTLPDNIENYFSKAVGFFAAFFGALFSLAMISVLFTHCKAYLKLLLLRKYQEKIKNENFELFKSHIIYPLVISSSVVFILGYLIVSGVKKISLGQFIIVFLTSIVFVLKEFGVQLGGLVVLSGAIPIMFGAGEKKRKLSILFLSFGLTMILISCILNGISMGELF